MLIPASKPPDDRVLVSIYHGQPMYPCWVPSFTPYPHVAPQLEWPCFARDRSRQMIALERRGSSLAKVERSLGST